MIRRAFGNALRDVLELLNISEAQLAEKGKISRAHIYEMEDGERDPKLSMIERIVRAVEVDFLAFQSEVAHHMAELGLIPHREIQFESELFPGGILSIAARSRIDIRSNAPFIERIFTLAKQLGARKILMDLSLCLFHFTKEEHYQGAKHGLQWMRENSFWPVVAVVANRTLDPFGASIAQEEGQQVKIFLKTSEAIEWLERQTVQTS